MQHVPFFRQISLRALALLEMVVKNCGANVQAEVATPEFMNDMKSLVKRDSLPVKNKTLELIQIWSHAFKHEPSYKVHSLHYRFIAHIRRLSPGS